MNKKTAPIFLVLAVIALASLACQFVTDLGGSKVKTTPAPSAGKLPTSQPDKSPIAPLGETSTTAKQPTTQPVPSEPQEIRQWAVSAKASSSYGETSWGPMQATGAPNVTDCVDNDKAWASKDSTTLEWIELSYDIPVVPTRINIHQSYNPSQVVEVDLISTDGTIYVAWQGKPKTVAYCPDEMAITIELDKKFLANKVVVIVDQSVLGLGWNEIDAVELVGVTEAGQSVTISPLVDEPPKNSDVPQNYAGWMAGSVYQGYLKVIVGQTRVDELDGLIGLTGKRSTENNKPRPDHADTFIYDFDRDDMRAFVYVTTQGVVYSKFISSGTHPSDFKLDTVNKSTYDQLDAIYKRDKVIPYNVMASLLGHPGFLRQAKIRLDDNKLVEDYQWYNANGDQIYGAFFDGKLTGMAGLAFIPK
jgi:hypothetical protein